jgi:hypothetical protein
MTDQLISFETAKLAKEKSFNEDMCHCGGFPDCICTDLRPTQSLLQKWLREVHHYHVIAEPYPHSDGFLRWNCLVNNLRKTTNNCFLNYAIMSPFKGTYEEALEIGLQEALKLI